MILTIPKKSPIFRRQGSAMSPASAGATGSSIWMVRFTRWWNVGWFRRREHDTVTLWLFNSLLLKIAIYSGFSHEKW